MQDHESRIAKIEEFIASFNKLRTTEQSAKLTQDARYWALHSITKELAIHAGLSEEKFIEHFEIRKNHYHDKFLLAAEDIAPRRAGELDQRDAEAIPNSDGYPPLF